jgi:hypothetical protein
VSMRTTLSPLENRESKDEGFDLCVGGVTDVANISSPSFYIRV